MSKKQKAAKKIRAAVETKAVAEVFLLRLPAERL